MRLPFIYIGDRQSKRFGRTYRALTLEIQNALQHSEINAANVFRTAALLCVNKIIQRDNVLRSIGSVAGDLDGNQTVKFAGILSSTQNFGTKSTSYASGNIHLAAGVGFPDFLILSRNFALIAA